ncbi:MAG: transglutaminase domain-containing protein [Anaerolineales bacterium]|nr:transglutaminase domain-containing protein [Anaerolineales bacterium]
MSQNSTAPKLSDYQHPEVRAAAARITDHAANSMQKLENIFYYVRDEIKFGMPQRWDKVKASETIACKTGYCNTKATLFHALCIAAGIPSRIHTGLIDLQIMDGVIPGAALQFAPKTGCHSWMEVLIGDQWHSIDSYINDLAFYRGALKLLHASGRKTGYSISELDAPSSCEFNFGQKGFVHMGAVVEDHGVWDDFSTYMASDRYIPMPGLMLITFPALVWIAKRNAESIRAHGE